MAPDHAATPALPALWIYGPPGVGKSTVGWEIYRGLRPPCAFVDIDQLGMCYPEPPDDPGRHQLKAANLAAVACGYHASGASCIVVSGVVDAERGVGNLPGLDVTWRRLRANREEIVRRLTSRGETQYDLDDVWREAELLDTGIVDAPAIETTGLAVSDVVDRVCRTIGDWPGPGRRPRPAAVVEATSAGGSILWLCGPTGVGKSAVGFAVFQRLLNGSRPVDQLPKGGVAFVDLDQLAFCRPAGRHKLKAVNLAAVWANFRRAGAARLVVVGPASSAADIEHYTAALPQATFTVIRLHASPEGLTRRIALRGVGRSWAQPGDQLRGQAAGRLAAAARAAIADSAALEETAVGDLRIDTTDTPADETASAVLAGIGWSDRNDMS